jgi:hypothetical protein
MSEGRPPKTFQWMEAVNLTLADIMSRLAGIVRPGAVFKSGFRPDDLPQYFYHANGDRYGVNTDQGKVLVAMSDNWKSDWKITISGGTINLPNFYSSDGRGYFDRSGTTPGVIQGDAIRNITGYVGGSDGKGGQMILLNNTSNGGAFTSKQVYVSNVYPMTGANSDASMCYMPQFDASRVVPTDLENRPLNVTMTPVVYLGV